MGRDSAKSLAPGFRFHPTDEELVRFYLKRKVTGKPLRFDHISVVDVYKSEPWDLPGKSKLKSRDLEWYFFSVLDKKYGNGSRTNRATEKGYWKTTGKDRPVRHNLRTFGMKKTLVYHSGRAPKGARSNWVMHEYRLVDEDLENAGISQDAYVICRIFQKSGSGPKNGEQYGAPFVEEEWEDDDAFVPKEEEPVDEVLVSDGAYVEFNELDQKLDAGTNPPPLDAPLPVNFYYGETSNSREHSGDLVGDDRKPLSGTEEPPQLAGEQTCLNLPEQCGMDLRPVKDEYFIDINGNLVDYLLDEQYVDATENLPLGEALFLEADDLSNTIDACPADFDMVDEYLNYFDADDDNDHNMAFDPSEILGTENSISEQPFVNQKLVTGETEQTPLGSQQLTEAHDSNEASSSKQKPEATKFDSDSKYPFMKQASHMLGGMPAPPAFALEFPAKDAVLQLNSVAPSSSSVHVTAGIIRIRNVAMDGHCMDQVFCKNGNDFVLSLGLFQPFANSAPLDPISGVLSGKTESLISRGLFMFMFMFIWVLIFSVSFKIGSYIYTR